MSNAATVATVTPPAMRYFGLRKTRPLRTAPEQIKRSFWPIQYTDLSFIADVKWQAGAGPAGSRHMAS